VRENHAVDTVDECKKYINLRPDFHFSPFISFIVQFEKKYNSIENLVDRFYIFKDNLKYIETTNAENNTYTLGLNHFADMTNDEYKELLMNNEEKSSLLLGSDANLQLQLPKNYCKDKSYPTSKSYLNAVDWRENNAVTAVKNQEQCGSCWSFSTTGAIEGLYAIQTGKLVSFSEQQLVDCSTSYGNHGCNGGIMQYAFSYIVDNGITSESEYPYVSGTTQKSNACSAFSPITKISGCNNVPSNELQLTYAVENQPVSVSIEADARSFQLYKSGVYTNADCGTKLDHGVLAVGYGSQNGQDYWIVKNSWGVEWGDKGYIYIARNSVESSVKGLCGIAMDASYPSSL
jgi:C1A family cysteine protease